MACSPPDPRSLESLRRLREQVAQRGDECLSLLLAGVELYVSIGRELELLETMRSFAHDAEEMVRNTPSAAELRKLYENSGSAPPPDSES